MISELETKLRIKVVCECGAKILCKTRIVGQTRKCPACSRPFEVPDPAPPPEGDIWKIKPNASIEEYRLMEKTLNEYCAAIQAAKNRPDLFDDIMRTLQVIRDFQDHFCK